MSEEEKAIVRACLEQVELGLTEAREVRTWWTLLSELNKASIKEMIGYVAAARAILYEDDLLMPPT